VQAEREELKLLIHKSQAGAVIGKGGGKIKEIKEVGLLMETFSFFISYCIFAGNQCQREGFWRSLSHVHRPCGEHTRRPDGNAGSAKTGSEFGP